MSEKKLTFDQEQRIHRKRYAKAGRFIERFFHQARAKVEKPETDRAALEEILRHVNAATQEEWKAVTKDMNDEHWQRTGTPGKEDVPSGHTVELIKQRLRGYIERLDKAANDEKAALDDVVEAIRERGTGTTPPEEIYRGPGHYDRQGVPTDAANAHSTRAEDKS